jgi:ATP-dependent Lhr-like helicase
VEPVPVAALARFLPAWQGVTGSRARGAEGLLRVVEQLAGAVLPASALETLVLPSRVAGYLPAMLDELTAAGEVTWCGASALPGDDGWVALAPADVADLLLPAAEPEPALTPLHRAVLDALDGDQALFFRTLSDRAGATDDQALAAALWDLVWAGLLTNDTLAPLRALLGPGRAAHQPRRRAPGRARYGTGRWAAAAANRPARPAMPSRTGPPTTAGRWSRLPAREPDPTRQAHALAEVLLDRHGVLTRGAVAAERVPGGFAAVYPVLRAAEEAGRCRRGYFVEGLGAAQFASPGAVDRLRTYGADRREPAPAVVLAATDPAQPYGAALPWPAQATSVDGAPAGPAAGSAPAGATAGSAAAVGPVAVAGPAARGHRPGRKAGALVVLVDGDLTLYVERGGRTLLSWSDEPARLQPAADALALAVRDGSLGRLAVERADGAPVLTSPLAAALEAAGFHPTPRGLRLRA